MQYFTQKDLKIKCAIFLTLFSFIVESIAPVSCAASFSPRTGSCLQVPSIFENARTGSPGTKDFSPFSLGEADNAQLRIELATILLMAAKGKPFYEINIELEKAYSDYFAEKNRKKRKILEVSRINRKTDGSISVSLSMGRAGKERKELEVVFSPPPNPGEDGILGLLDSGKVAFLKSESVVKTKIPSYAVEAPSGLYYLREKCRENVNSIEGWKVSSIVPDEKTGGEKYFYSGRAFIPLRARVYYLEGRAWDLPEEIIFPPYVKELLNTPFGAFVVITGGVYEQEEVPELIARFVREPDIRELGDAELYRRYGMKRVYDHSGAVFDLPVLGTGGRSVMLPFRYEITEKGSSRRISREEDTEGPFPGEEALIPVFGLEFKNIGTPAYGGHNINRSFPPTVFRKYEGLAGIFLDWQHQLASGLPVGLGTRGDKAGPLESCLLEMGVGLSKLTAAEVRFMGEFTAQIRVPLSDHRRLSVFFNERGIPQRAVFRDVLKEFAVDEAQYLCELAEKYGRQMRLLLEKGIIQGEHGSLINVDIRGKVTDLEDFWKTEGLSEEDLKKDTDAWIDNLLRIAELSERPNMDNAVLEGFFKGFFGRERDLFNAIMAEKASVEERIKTLVFLQAVRASTGNCMLAPGISGIAVMGESGEDGGREVRFSEKGERRILNLSMPGGDLYSRVRLRGLKACAGDDQKKLFLFFMRAFNKTGANLMVFPSLKNRFAGIIAPFRGVAGIREDWKEDPRMFFYLIAEYLISAADLILLRRDNELVMRSVHSGEEIKIPVLKGAAGEISDSARIFFPDREEVKRLGAHIFGEKHKDPEDILRKESALLPVLDIDPDELELKQLFLDITEKLIRDLGSGSPATRTGAIKVIRELIDSGMLGKDIVRESGLLSLLMSSACNVISGVAPQSAECLGLLSRKGVFPEEGETDLLQYHLVRKELLSTVAGRRKQAAFAAGELIKSGLMSKDIITSPAVMKRTKDDIFYGNTDEKIDSIVALKVLIETGAFDERTLRAFDKDLLEELFTILKGKIERPVREPSLIYSYAVKTNVMKREAMALIRAMAKSGIISGMFERAGMKRVLPPYSELKTVLHRHLLDTDHELGLETASVISHLAGRGDRNYSEGPGKRVRKKLYRLLAEEVHMGGQKAVYAIKKIQKLTKCGFLEKQEQRQHLDIGALFGEMSYSEEHRKSFLARILTEAVRSGMVTAEDASGPGMADALRALSSKQDTLAPESAELLLELYRKRLVKKEEIPLRAVAASLKKLFLGGQEQDRKKVPFLVKGYLEEDLLTKEDIPTGEDVLGLLEACRDIKSPSFFSDLRAVAGLQKKIDSPLLGTVPAGREALGASYRKAYGEELPEGYYYFYLRILPHMLKAPGLAPKMPDLFTPVFRELSLACGEDFYEELIKALKAGDDLSDLKKDLYIRLQRRLIQKIEKTSSHSRIYEYSEKLGRLMAVCSDNGWEIEENVTRAFRLLQAQFVDRGICRTNFQAITEPFFINKAPSEEVSLPIEFPHTRARDIPLVDKSIFNRTGLTEGRHVDTKGRTIIFQKDGGGYVALKFCKKGEDPSRLLHENKVFAFLNEMKSRTGLLEGEYPAPLLPDIRGTVRIRERDMPVSISEHVKKAEKELHRKGKKIDLYKENGVYICMFYETPDTEYFTYLDRIEDEKAREKSLHKNVHDLFVLARYGIFHPDICELFHNVTMQRDSNDRGWYIWMVDVVRRWLLPAGAGRLHAWQQAIEYPNLRATGIADFAEMAHIDQFISLRNENSNYLFEDLKRFPEIRRREILKAYYMGNYLLVLLLIEAKKMRSVAYPRWDEEADVKRFAARIRGIYETAYRAYTGKEADEEVASFDWEQLARQVIFFVSRDYRHYLDAFFPGEIFDNSEVALLKGDGWGYIHKHIILSELNAAQIGKDPGKILEYYFEKVPESETRTGKGIYRFRQWAGREISELTEGPLRTVLLDLFNEYSAGWRSDGRHEDLGPVNGPFPLVEAVKANYYFTMLMTGGMSLKAPGKRARAENKDDRIGKRAFIRGVSRKGPDKILLDVTDTRRRTRAIELRAVPGDGAGIQESLRRTAEAAARKYRLIVEDVRKLCAEEKIELFSYALPVQDLVGLNLPEEDLIALCEAVRDDPVALFHEAAAFLIAKGKLRLHMKNALLTVETASGSVHVAVEDTLEELLEEGEEWAGWATERFNRKPHYLLRILQREIFADKDRELTSKIEQLISGIKKEERDKGVEVPSRRRFFMPEEVVMELREDLDDVERLRDDIYAFCEKYLSLQDVFSGSIPEVSDAYLEKCFTPDTAADLYYLYKKYGFDVFQLLLEKRTCWQDEQWGRTYVFEVRFPGQLDVLEHIEGSRDRFVGGVNEERIFRSRYGTDEDVDKGHNLMDFTAKVWMFLKWAEEARRTLRWDIDVKGGEKLVEYYSDRGWEIERDGRFAPAEGFSGSAKAFSSIEGGVKAAIFPGQMAGVLKKLLPVAGGRWSQREVDRFLALTAGIERSVLIECVEKIIERGEVDASETGAAEMAAKVLERAGQIPPAIGKNTRVLSAFEHNGKLRAVCRGKDGVMHTVTAVKRRSMGEVLKRIKEESASAGEEKLIAAVNSLKKQLPGEIFFFEQVKGDLFGFALPGKGIIALYEGFSKERAALLHELCEYLIAKGDLALELEARVPLLLRRAGLYRAAAGNAMIRRFLSGRLRLSETAGGSTVLDVRINGKHLDVALKGRAQPHYLLRAMAGKIYPGENIWLSRLIDAERKKAVIDEALRNTAIREGTRIHAEELAKAIAKTGEDTPENITSLINELVREDIPGTRKAFTAALRYIDATGWPLEINSGVTGFIKLITDGGTDGKATDVAYGQYGDLIDAIAGGKVSPLILHPSRIERITKLMRAIGVERTMGLLNVVSGQWGLGSEENADRCLEVMEGLSRSGGTGQAGKDPVRVLRALIETVNEGFLPKEVLQPGTFYRLCDSAGRSAGETILTLCEIAADDVFKRTGMAGVERAVKMMLSPGAGKRISYARLSALRALASGELLRSMGLSGAEKLLHDPHLAGFSSLNAERMLEIISAMAKAGNLNDEEAVHRTTDILEALAGADIGNRLLLTGAVEDLVRAARQEGLEGDLLKPRVLLYFLDKTPGRAYGAIKEMESFILAQRPHKAQLPAMVKWVLSGHVVEKGILAEYMGLAPEEKRIYLSSFEKIRQDLLSGADRYNEKFHMMAGYELLVSRCLLMPIAKKRPEAPDYEAYKRMVTGDVPPVDILSRKEKAEVRYAAYEAVKLFDFLILLSEKARQQGRELLVVKNLSYGAVPVDVMRKELENKGIRVIETNAKSTYAHGHPEVVHGEGGRDDPELFSDDVLEYILKERPLIAVVDGSASIDSETLRAKGLIEPHFPDSYQAFRNYFHAVSRDPAPEEFALQVFSSPDGGPMEDMLRGSKGYNDVRLKALNLSKGDLPSYSLFFWHAGGGKISICSRRQASPVPPDRRLYNEEVPGKTLSRKITGPAVVFVLANMEDAFIPGEVRGDDEGKEPQEDPSYHSSGYFDYISLKNRVGVEKTSRGPEPFRVFDRYYRNCFLELKKKYSSRADTGDEKDIRDIAGRRKSGIIPSAEELRGLLSDRGVDISADEGRLEVFLGEYARAINNIPLGDGRDRKGYFKRCVNPEMIADLYYLKKEYSFDVFELIREKETFWSDEKKGMKYVFRYHPEEGHMVRIADAGSDKKARIKGGYIKEGRLLLEDRYSDAGRNIGNFLIKAHNFILWAVEGRRKKEMKVSKKAIYRLTRYYESTGASIRRVEEDDVRAYYELFGGLKAGILTADQGRLLKKLDPRIWRVWSQSQIDRLFGLIDKIDRPKTVEAMEGFSRIAARTPPAGLRGKTPEEVAAFILDHAGGSKIPGREEGKIPAGITENGVSISESGRQAYNLLKRSDTRARELIMLAARAERTGNALPVDIIVDLSLIPSVDVEENMETWALLLLMCAENEGLRVIFELPRVNDSTPVRGKMLRAREKSADREKAYTVLRACINEILRARGFGDKEIKSFIAEKVSYEKRSGALQIPIVSRGWLLWAEENFWRNSAETSPLDDMQYPVAMESGFSYRAGQAGMPSFEAALSIGLIKARLAGARLRGERLDPHVLTRIAEVLQELLQSYDKFKGRVSVERSFLEDMVDPRPMVRLSHAVLFALPPVTRHMVGELKFFHDLGQSLLRAA
jgi:hypothetical protein